jgi:hypothetical protein
VRICISRWKYTTFSHQNVIPEDAIHAIVAAANVVTIVFVHINCHDMITFL